MLHFVTLFDSNYLLKGLSLHRSLCNLAVDWRLFILCMDDMTLQLLEKMELTSVELIRLADIMDADLEAAQASRGPAEFCWTCTAPLMERVLARVPEDGIAAYIDADLYFYGDLSPIFDEMANSSVLVHGHRFAPEYQDREATSGIYNVGLVGFRNNAVGRECLAWWRNKCLEACKLDPEAGYCGDQKYLDDWPDRFPGVRVLQHPGAGLAPWNITNHRVARLGKSVTADGWPLIFYHHHSFRLTNWHLAGTRVAIAARGYRFTREHLSLIYQPYLRTMTQELAIVRRIAPGFSGGIEKVGWRELLRAYAQKRLLIA